MGRSRCRATSADIVGVVVEVLLELFSGVHLSDSSDWLNGRRHSKIQPTMAQMAFVCMSLVAGAIFFPALLASLQRRTKGRLHHQATLRIMFAAFGLYILAASYIAMSLFTGKRSKQHTVTIPSLRHLLGLIGVGTPRHYLSKAPARFPGFARPNLIDLGPNTLPQLCFSLFALPILSGRSMQRAMYAASSAGRRRQSLQSGCLENLKQLVRYWLRERGPTVQATLAFASSIFGNIVQKWVARQGLVPGNPQQGFNCHSLGNRADRWQCLVSCLPSNCNSHAVTAIENACHCRMPVSRTKLGTKRR